MGCMMKLRFINKEINILKRKISSKVLVNSRKVIKKNKGKEFKIDKFSNYGTESYRDFLRRDYKDFLEYKSALEILDYYKKYKTKNLEKIPITVAKIGEILIITIPGELFVEFSNYFFSRVIQYFSHFHLTRDFNRLKFLSWSNIYSIFP